MQIYLAATTRPLSRPVLPPTCRPFTGALVDGRSSAAEAAFESGQIHTQTRAPWPLILCYQLPGRRSACTSAGARVVEAGDCPRSRFGETASGDARW